MERNPHSIEEQLLILHMPPTPLAYDGTLGLVAQIERTEGILDSMLAMKVLRLK